jgi:hypothetical protein
MLCSSVARESVDRVTIGLYHCAYIHSIPELNTSTSTTSNAPHSQSTQNIYLHASASVSLSLMHRRHDLIHANMPQQNKSSQYTHASYETPQPNKPNDRAIILSFPQTRKTTERQARSPTETYFEQDMNNRSCRIIVKPPKHYSVSNVFRKQSCLNSNIHCIPGTSLYPRISTS